VKKGLPIGVRHQGSAIGSTDGFLYFLDNAIGIEYTPVRAVPVLNIDLASIDIGIPNVGAALYGRPGGGPIGPGWDKIFIGSQMRQDCGLSHFIEIIQQALKVLFIAWDDNIAVGPFLQELR
jgi:hypothetical protein